MCLSVYTYFLHPCWWCLFILCLCVCVCSSLARRWFLSAAQTRELILPKGLTVDLVTVAIFAYSSSSCTSSSSSSLNLPHALSTSNIQVGWAGSGVSLATHTECKSMYFFFFICLFMPFQPSFHYAENSFIFKFALLAQQERNLCCWKKYISYRLIFFSYIVFICLRLSSTRLLRVLILLFGSNRISISPLPLATVTTVLVINPFFLQPCLVLLFPLLLSTPHLPLHHSLIFPFCFTFQAFSSHSHPKRQPPFFLLPLSFSHTSHPSYHLFLNILSSSLIIHPNNSWSGFSDHRLPLIKPSPLIWERQLILDQCANYETLDKRTPLSVLSTLPSFPLPFAASKFTCPSHPTLRFQK